MTDPNETPGEQPSPGTGSADSGDDRYRPVVDLDVDGVLRVPEPFPGERTEVVAIEITLTYDQYPRFSHGAPPWDDDGTHTGCHFLSATGVAWVQSLLERGVDVRLATTWDRWANTYFARPLGLPELPVLTGKPRYGERSSQWKARVIAAATRGRPVLWVDDQPWPEKLYEQHTPRALTGILAPNPETGITIRDVDTADTWLTLASSPDGQDELRRQWRRKRDRLRRHRDAYARGRSTQ
ncbi:hypothetical protein [Microbacterium aurantiacum]|uniref:hypothetical protein n=1 Tax=Microbacterium aurantiacum TaxID=162393 RepID=UPI001F45F1B9|nr:hypothetical protein [Microbacterium aurantiacum]